MATSLTFGNHLKFGQDSCHTSEGRQIPSTIERERESTRSSARTTPSSRRASNGPHACESIATVGGQTKARQWFSSRSRLWRQQGFGIHLLNSYQHIFMISNFSQLLHDNLEINLAIMENILIKISI